MLKISHLTKSFPAQNCSVLNNISLTLNKGDFCIVLGNNGSGKSTLLKTILGEYSPDAGTIVLNHRNITHKPLYQRAKNISCVFQDVTRGTIAEMTVAENLSLANIRARHASFKFYRSYQAVFVEKLASLDMGLEHHLDSFCGALSGGQRQAIAFMMATLHTPDLLLLDEHCSALDPKSANIVMQKTAEFIDKTHISTLMVTHRLQDALQYGNRLIILDRGKIELDVKNAEKKMLTMEFLLEQFYK